MNIDAKYWQDIEQIVQLSAKHRINELEVENPMYCIRVRAAFTQHHTPNTLLTAVEPSQITPENIPSNKALFSNYVGRIQLAPDVVSQPCIQVGNMIKQGDTVAYVACLGKLLPIISEKAGIIKAVYVENQQAIQYGQVLFELE